MTNIVDKQMNVKMHLRTEGNTSRQCTDTIKTNILKCKVTGDLEHL